MKREDSLNAFITHDAPDNERFVYPTSSARNYCAGEYLNAFLVAFFDSAVDVDRITYFEMRNMLFEAFIFNSVQQFSFHRFISYGIFYCILFFTRRLGFLLRRTLPVFIVLP